MQPCSLRPLVVLLALLVLGCAGRSEPLASDTIDFTGPQAPAVITLSDPQIYSRETLVNDRRAEERHLERLLEESAGLEFEPQIQRDLASLTRTAVELRAAYEPLSGSRSEGDEAGDGAAAPELPEPPEAGSGAAADEADATDDEDDVDDEPVPTAAASPIRATPRERFRDLQAYRAELRAALAETQLDDSHDQGQNTLYRLQFRATVLPGAHHDKMAVARLTLSPPELEDADVLALYKIWLGHVTYRLNQAVGERLETDPSYLLLGMGLDRSLFHATSVFLGEAGRLEVALPPGIYREWKKIASQSAGASGRDDFAALAERLHGGAAALAELERALGETDETGERARQALELGDDCRPGPRADSWRSAAGDTIESLFWLMEDLAHVEPFVSASIRGLGSRNLLEPAQGIAIDRLIEDVVDGSEGIDWLRQLLIETNQRCGERLGTGASLEAQVGVVPRSFRDGLLLDEVARGGADVYATGPVELAQQISTSASRLRSFEVALGLAAALPGSGVAAGGGFDRVRSQRADLEALERLPLVVGFAERRKLAERRKEDPQFGWVFGPRASPDAAAGRLALGQPVVNHPVTADLSIPGWWPWVTLDLETAWVGNWHGEEVLEGPAREQRFRVYLPLNRADLDGLTEHLAQETVGGVLPYTRIARVEPEEVPPCTDRMTFLVHGTNVWRSSRAFLAGLEAEAVEVLPDMAGLAVTFAGLAEHLASRSRDLGTAVLTLWTRDGSSSVRLTLADPDASCGPAPARS